SNLAGTLKEENPWRARGWVAVTVCGVGIAYCPFGSLRFNKANACGLTLEPSADTATPPCAPASPPNNLRNAARERHLVKGGEKKLLVPPPPTPLTWRMPW